MNETAAPTKYAFDERWAPALRPDGHVQVSSYFLEHYHRLQPYPLTHGEAMFVIHLMQHKWSAQAPFPSYPPPRTATSRITRHGRGRRVTCSTFEGWRGSPGPHVSTI
jgi:hypothetical protein